MKQHQLSGGFDEALTISVYSEGQGMGTSDIERHNQLSEKDRSLAFHRASKAGNVAAQDVLLHQDPDDPKGWQDFANCYGVDPDLFFPERGASTNEAREVCEGCVVRDDCLEYALTNSIKFGIWGGLSGRERRRILRQRNRSQRTALDGNSSSTS